jgi:hypothetical protein
MSHKSKFHKPQRAQRKMQSSQRNNYQGFSFAAFALPAVALAKAGKSFVTFVVKKDF